MIDRQAVQNICTLLLTDSENAAVGLELLKGQNKVTKAAVQEQLQPLLDGFKKKSLRGITGIWKAIDKNKLNQAETAAVWGMAPLNKGIEKIDLYGIHWTELPQTVGHLSDLKLLRIMESKIEALPDEIGQLTSLNKLDFSFNPLRKIPDAIGQLRQLKILRLSGNGRYLTNIPDAIGEMGGLEELLLAQNALKKLPATLGQLQQLKVLDVRSNQLTTLPETIGHLSNLEILNISGNPLEKLPTSLRQLNQLKALNISSLNATLQDLTFLKGLTSLEELSMNAFSVEVEALQTLKQLELRDDTITDIPVEIGQLKQLEVLIINSSGLEDLSVEVLEQLPNLKKVKAGFMAPISSATIRALEEQFPQIKFGS